MGRRRPRNSQAGTPGEDACATAARCLCLSRNDAEGNRRKQRKQSCSKVRLHVRVASGASRFSEGSPNPQKAALALSSCLRFLCCLLFNCMDTDLFRSCVRTARGLRNEFPRSGGGAECACQTCGQAWLYLAADVISREKPYGQSMSGGEILTYE